MPSGVNPARSIGRLCSAKLFGGRRMTCLMCGTEEEGTLATGLLPRLLFRKAVWKFEKLNGYAARTFTDPEWYLETRGIVRNFSFPTDVVLQHASPPLRPGRSWQPG